MLDSTDSIQTSHAGSLPRTDALIAANAARAEAREAVLAGGRGERPQPLLTAQLRPYPAVVDHVVTVGGAGDRLQDGGEVEVRDTERGEVGHGLLGGGEGLGDERPGPAAPRAEAA